MHCIIFANRLILMDFNTRVQLDIAVFNAHMNKVHVLSTEEFNSLMNRIG